MPCEQPHHVQCIVASAVLQFRADWQRAINDHRCFSEPCQRATEALCAIVDPKNKPILINSHTTGICSVLPNGASGMSPGTCFYPGRILDYNPQISVDLNIIIINGNLEMQKKYFCDGSRMMQCVQEIIEKMEELVAKCSQIISGFCEYDEGWGVREKLHFVLTFGEQLRALAEDNSTAKQSIASLGTVHK